MSGEDEHRFTQVLLDIKGDVGETRGKINGMCSDVEHIKSRFNKVMLREDCTGRHVLLEQSLSKELAKIRTNLQDDLARGIADLKKSTSGNYPAVKPPTPAEMEEALQTRADERAEKRRKRITQIVGLALSVCGLTGAIGAATWKIVTTLQSVNAVVQAQPQAMRDEINKAEVKQKIIYIQVPAKTDPAIKRIAKPSTSR